MVENKLPFQFDWGKVAGQPHLLAGENCQDALEIKEGHVAGEPYFIGVVCDGCGSSKHSEVGAQLGAHFVIHFLRQCFISAARFDQHDFTSSLWQQLLKSVQQNIEANTLLRVSKQLTSEKQIAPRKAFYDDLAQEKLEFIMDYLLFTVFGFYIYRDYLHVFTVGDGLYLINDQLVVTDQNNAASYPAYTFVPPEKFTTQPNIPETFQHQVYPLADVNRFAIGTDGWFQLKKELKQDLWDLNGRDALQKQMNIWQHRQKFGDDATLILLKRR